MTVEKGTLKKIKKGFRVVLPTKKGSTDYAIPDKAFCFRADDGQDGLEVDVERDAQKRIVKVTIPGKTEVAPSPVGGHADHGRAPDRGRGRGGSRGRGGRPTRNYGGHGQPPALKDLSKASPSVLGLPFHNPYTFLSFSDKAPTRRQPTPLTADELPDQRDRLTGILELHVTTQSPLLTCKPDPIQDKDGHKTYSVLRIGPDVIVPATGIRGALRTLMTIITGGTLAYMNPHAYLCQGRDVNLGPAGLSSPPGTPKNAFLAEVVRPGTAYRSGIIQVGDTTLVKLVDLEQCYRRKFKDERKPKARRLWVQLDSGGRPRTITSTRTAETPWQLKLSGRPINLKGKREGLFLAGKTTIELPPEIWADYSGRNAHGERVELKKGDLVWIEPKDPDANQVTKPDQVASLQWARWGKRGQAVKDKVPQYTFPDYVQSDRMVDEITDLFGQVSPDREKQATAFAARVRPDNLVFFDAAEKVERVTLAPLQPPHPGCIAFYRDNDDPDQISEADRLRGYKVYRTTRERGADAPWKYEVQGVYDQQGKLKTTLQKVNKTCDLVPEGMTGTLRIAFRSLTERELALLCQACHVPWRLGGGKPLGLGLCNVLITNLLDEDGAQMQIPGWNIEKDSSGAIRLDGWEQLVQDLQPRVRMWAASQQPVERLRYPRAVTANNFGKTRGGHAWFQRHAAPRKVTKRGDGQRETGLEPMHVGGALLQQIKTTAQAIDQRMPLIAAQVLPLFDPEDPLADVLYGYDAFPSATEDGQRPRRTIYHQIEPFDPGTHVTGQERSEGNQGKNAQFRKDQKRERTDNG